MRRLLFIVGVTLSGGPFENLLIGPISVSSDSSVTHSKQQSKLFPELRASKFFIDKTDFVHELLINQPKYLYLTAPPLLGKSSLLHMVGLFCNLSSTVVGGALKFVEGKDRPAHNVFHDTLISKNEEFFKTHFNNYSVIFIDFTPLTNTQSYDSYKTNFCSVVRGMLHDYRFLADLSSLQEAEKVLFKNYAAGPEHCLKNFESAVNDARTLIKILKKTFGKEVIVLGDAFDSLLHAHLVNYIPESNLIVEHFGPFVQAMVLKNSPEGMNPDRTLFVGSLNLGGIMSMLADDLTHLNYFHNEQTAKPFGITNPEVEKLLAQFSLKDHLTIVDDWYNGFGVLGSELKLFNISAVVSYIQLLKEPKNVPPATTTFASLSGIQDLFADCRIGSCITESLFGEGVRIRAPDNVTFFQLTELQEKMKSGNVTATNFKLTTRQIDLFQTFIVDLGLLTVAQDMGSARLVKPTNRFNLNILRGYWFRSGHAQTYFNVSGQQQETFTKAVGQLAATNDSLQLIGEAIFNITSTKVPAKDSTFTSLMYLCTRNATEVHGEGFVVESGRTAHLGETGKAAGKIGLVLILKQKKLGAVWEMKKGRKRKCGAVANQTLALVKERKYSDIFETDPEYSKLGITDKLLLGVVVSADGSLYISGDAHTDKGTVPVSFMKEKAKAKPKTNMEDSIDDFEW